MKCSPRKRMFSSGGVAQVGMPHDDGHSIPLRVWPSSTLEAVVGINLCGTITTVCCAGAATRLTQTFLEMLD